MFMIILNLSFLLLILATSTESQRTLYENDLCKSGDSRWICKKLQDCQTAQEAIKGGQRPQICTFDGLSPVVCCPPSAARPTTTTKAPKPNTPRPSITTSSSTTNQKSKAKQMCVKYAEYVFRIESSPILLATEDVEPVKLDECARSIQPLVVGGEDAAAKEFPHMAQIGYGQSPRIAWLCGGSLISERFVLSAAHCSNPQSRGPASWARLGDLDTASDKDDARPVIVRITQRFDHPDYDAVELYNDISIFKLEKDVTLSHYLRPICLYMDDKVIKEAVATGWGHTSWGGRGSNTLKKVRLNMVDNANCNRTYSSSIGKQLPQGISGSTMICAGDEAGKDSCQGDSGGPLQIALTEPYCTYAQVGVVSFGKSCGSSVPGVYTRVSYYVPWIESIVWPS